MTTLLLRADAGPRLGVGHLSRCVAFAEEAVARGWQVVLSGEIASGQWLGARLAELEVPLLPAARDAGSLAGRARELGADLVLVDHYTLAGELWAAVRAAGARLVSMEDGGYGRRPADVVVDCGFVPGVRPDDGSLLALSGPRFAPLRATVRDAREHRGWMTPVGDPPGPRPLGPAGGRGAGPTPSRVVVVLGGGDASEAMRAVLRALRDTGLAMDVLAVSSTQIAPPAPAAGQRFTMDGPRSDLLQLFAEADLVVSAAGVTLFELCCIGVPTALVLLADNQAATYRDVVGRVLAAGLGGCGELVADPGPATEVLGDLLADPARRAGLAAATSGLVDGHGAGRVLDRIRHE